MEKINLNFFGEEVTIDTPKDLVALRAKISEKYSLSSSDVAEIILYYVKDSKKNYIINGNDFSKFKEFKIDTIFLDVSQNSKLYLKNVSQLKEEIKKETENEKDKKNEEKKEEKKEEEKKEEIDIEQTKQEIEKINSELVELTKAQSEKNQLYNDKISEIVKQIVELEKMKEHLTMERDLDFYELGDKKGELNKKKDELKKKIEPKKEVILKQAPKSKVRSFPGGPNHFPIQTEALRRNEEKRIKYFEKLNAAKEKRMKERKALEEQKALESKNEINLKDIKLNIPGAIPVFAKVNEVLKTTVEKVKKLAKEKVMTKEEKEIAKKEEDIIKQKEKKKKEQIEQIQKITRDAVNEINNLTKLVIEQSNSLIERINNPQLFKSQSSDDILLRVAPKVEKKQKLEIHFNVICDGCKVTPLRGNRYKCKICKNFDYCEDCYQKNKESHGHDFFIIEHPKCRNRLGHPNIKYCQRGIVHHKIMCDGCGMLPLAGWRHKCSICDEYNLCENCEERIGRKHDHPFIKIIYSPMLTQFNQNYIKLNSYEPNK